MELDRACPRLPICDEGKKKGFKLYFNEDMPSRNRRHNWSTTPTTERLYSRDKSSLESLMLMALIPLGIRWWDMTPKEPTPLTLHMYHSIGNSYSI